MHQVGRDTTISSIIKMANGMTYSKHTPSKGGEGSSAWYPNICPSRIFAGVGAGFPLLRGVGFWD